MPALTRFANGQQNAHRRDPSGGDPGGRLARQPRRGIRLRVRAAQATKRQYLSGEGDARRAVAAGRLRRLRRQSPRLPRLQRNPSRLLSDPGRRPAGADRRGRSAPSAPPKTRPTGARGGIAAGADRPPARRDEEVVRSEVAEAAPAAEPSTGEEPMPRAEAIEAPTLAQSLAETEADEAAVEAEDTEGPTTVPEPTFAAEPEQPPRRESLRCGGSALNAEREAPSDAHPPTEAEAATGAADSRTQRGCRHRGR